MCPRGEPTLRHTRFLALLVLSMCTYVFVFVPVCSSENHPGASGILMLMVTPFVLTQLLFDIVNLQTCSRKLCTSPPSSEVHTPCFVYFFWNPSLFTFSLPAIHFYMHTISAKLTKYLPLLNSLCFLWHSGRSKVLFCSFKCKEASACYGLS